MGTATTTTSDRRAIRLALAIALGLTGAITMLSLDDRPAVADQAGTSSTPNFAASVAVAARHSTCLIEDGVGLRCFGSNYAGQMANGERDPFGEAPASAYDATPISLPGGDPVQVVGDEAHFCALAEDGTASCWGENDLGQAGQTPSDGLTSPTPVAMPGDRQVAALTSGEDFTCALLVDGEVACWGDNGGYGLGDGTNDDSPTPVLADLPDGRTATMVAAADQAACAVLDDGRLSCWGNNAFLQAFGGSSNALLTPSAPQRIGGLDVVALAGGGRQFCAILDDAGLWCWGRTSHGSGQPPEEFDLGTGRAAAAVAVDDQYACVVDQSGQVGCWGSNADGMLGLGDDTVGVLSTPFQDGKQVDLGFGNTAAAVYVADRHACATLTDGSVTCWGRSNEGQLGFDVAQPGDASEIIVVREPQALIGHPLDGVVDVAAGSESACALLDDGDVRCWGGNDAGQLGAPGPRSSTVSAAVPIPGGDSAIQVAVGGETACAVTNRGGVVCWGDNRQGQAGDVSVGAPNTLPPTYIPLKLGEVYQEVGIGTAHSCGRQLGVVKCWGNNDAGQLGNNGGDSFDDVVRPVGTAFTDLSVGGTHACGLLDDDSAVCWGAGDNGQLGDGSQFDNVTADTRISLPPTLPPLTVTSIAAGGAHSCADLSNGRLGCFGEGSSGQIGTGDNNSNSAIDNNEYVNGPLLGFGEVALGLDHSCGVGTIATVGSALYCWGSADRGELGNGTEPAELYLNELGPPTPLPDDALPVSIAAGNSFTCAVLPDTTATCWGEQAGGRLGQGLEVSGITAWAGTRVLDTPVIVAPSTVVEADPDPDPDPDPVDAITPVDPARYWDSRNSPTFDRQFEGTGRLAAGSTQKIRIAGRGDVPADATGIVGNLTVIEPDAPGFGVIYPCTPELPTASNLNYLPGDILANNTVVPLDGNGDVCVFTQSGADYALDVNGFVPAGSPLVGINPARYLETRPGEPTFDGAAAGGGRVPAGQFVEVQIAGRGAVPADAAAAVVNATIITPDSGAFATLYPCGDRPTASNINYDAGSITPNGAIVKLSGDGTLCIYTHAGADVILDVSGFVPDGTASLVTSTPMRFLETRPGEPSVDGLFEGEGPNPAGETIEVTVAGRSGVPATATAAILNLAVIGPAADGFATLYPCGDLPFTSNLNYTTGAIRANNAVTRLSATGTVCVFTRDASDLILDVAGWLEAG